MAENAVMRCPTRWAALIAMAATLGCGDKGPSAPIDDTQPPKLVNVRVEPLVNAPLQPFHVEVEVRNPAGPVMQVQLDGRAGYPLLINGVLLAATNGVLDIYDDGTHGDLVAGDAIYTHDGFTLPDGVEGLASGKAAVIRLADAPSTEAVQLLFRTVDTTRVPPPATVDLAPDIRASSRVVSMAREDAQAFGNDNVVSAVSRRYFEAFPDDRHILVIVHPSRRAGLAAGLAYNVRPWASGTGMNTVRNGFGSPATLHIVVDAGATIWLPHDTGPGAFCLLIHEFTHQWAAYAGSLLSTSDSHWKFDVLARDSSGFGVDGVCNLNDLELYLAGWLPPDSVTTPLTADGFTLADLIAQLGPRVPAEGIRDLDAAVIVLYHRLLTRTEFAYFDRVAREFAATTSPLGLTWEEATGGRSTLNVVLPTPLAVAGAGPPVAR